MLRQIVHVWFPYRRALYVSDRPIRPGGGGVEVCSITGGPIEKIVGIIW